MACTRWTLKRKMARRLTSRPLSRTVAGLAADSSAFRSRVLRGGFAIIFDFRFVTPVECQGSRRGFDRFNFRDLVGPRRPQFRELTRRNHHPALERTPRPVVALDRAVEPFPDCFQVSGQAAQAVG